MGELHKSPKTMLHVARQRGRHVDEPNMIVEKSPADATGDDRMLIEPPKKSEGMREQYHFLFFVVNDDMW